MRVRSSFSVAKGFALGSLLLAVPLQQAHAERLSASAIAGVESTVATDADSAFSWGMATIIPTSGVPTQELIAPGSPDGTAASRGESRIESPNVDPNAPLPPVEYDVSRLPEPVREMRARIIAAAKTGSIEALRPLIGSGVLTTDFGGDGDTDPIDFLKSLSGDQNGREILAILIDVLDSGYVHLNAGTPNEIYAWPYFFAYPLDKLTPRQLVELYQIMTAGDFDDMKSYGAYVFYRVGIAPDGKWRFFVAGE